MATKDNVLGFLELHKGETVSGERLAEALNLSRNAIWKAVNSLREEGYMLEASPKRGYCLLSKNDKLSAQGIAKYLNSVDFYKFSLLDSVDSTNTAARRLAEGGEAEGMVVIANEQTAGKGRMGRSFFSPSGSGIYMSIILRPHIPASDALLITTAAAVSVAGAIEEVTGADAQIKWVNDIYCGGKKVCGILTEASMDFESGGITYAVLGIGINLTRPQGGFPGELDSVAVSVLGDSCEPDTKARLIALILEKFCFHYKELAQKHFMDEYRRRSCVIGKEVYVISSNSREEASVLEIDDDAGLVVKLKSGEVKHINSGEISIRVRNDD